MIEVMEWEWRQYDSDIIPENLFGEPTEDRRAEWRPLFDRKKRATSRNETQLSRGRRKRWVSV